MCLVCACVIKCLIKVNGVILLSALYFFWICVCLHMLCRKLYRETSVGETHHDNKTRSNRENHEIQKSNESRTVYDEAGFEQTLEWAARPPLWAAWPITAPIRLALYPRSGLQPIHSIFICFAFRFEPN